MLEILTLSEWQLLILGTALKNTSLFISTIKRSLILDDLLITRHVNSNVKYKTSSLV